MPQGLGVQTTANELAVALGERWLARIPGPEFRLVVGNGFAPAT